jgi:hypothetical protein
MNEWLAASPMRILMTIIVILMVASVLSLSVVGGRRSKQIAEGQPLMASTRVMGPR